MVNDLLTFQWGHCPILFEVAVSSTDFGKGLLSEHSDFALYLDVLLLIGMRRHHDAKLGHLDQLMIYFVLHDLHLKLFNQLFSDRLNRGVFDQIFMLYFFHLLHLV